MACTSKVDCVKSTDFSNTWVLWVTFARVMCVVDCALKCNCRWKTYFALVDNFQGMKEGIVHINSISSSSKVKLLPNKKDSFGFFSIIILLLHVVSLLFTSIRSWVFICVYAVYVLTELWSLLVRNDLMNILIMQLKLFFYKKISFKFPLTFFIFNFFIQCWTNWTIYGLKSKSLIGTMD